jgi:hypothetical protein
MRMRATEQLSKSGAPETRSAGAKAALLAAGVYVFLAELLLLCPSSLRFQLTLERLSPADTLSLLTGAVTAAALSSVYLQVEQARREAAARGKQQVAEAALRADELHAQFHAFEMARQRAIALQFLKHLRDHRLVERYAQIWVSDSNEEIDTPVRDLDGKPLTYLEQSWALEVVIAFFVRVGAHLRLYREHLPIGSEQAKEVLAPFCWSYWQAAGLGEFACACEREWSASQERHEHPYFINMLKLVREATLPHRPFEVETSDHDLNAPLA